MSTYLHPYPERGWTANDGELYDLSSEIDPLEEGYPRMHFKEDSSRRVTPESTHTGNDSPVIEDGRSAQSSCKFARRIDIKSRHLLKSYALKGRILVTYPQYLGAPNFRNGSATGWPLLPFSLNMTTLERLWSPRLNRQARSINRLQKGDYHANTLTKTIRPRLSKPCSQRRFHRNLRTVLD